VLEWKVLQPLQRELGSPVLTYHNPGSHTHRVLERLVQLSANCRGRSTRLMLDTLSWFFESLLSFWTCQAGTPLISPSDIVYDLIYTRQLLQALIGI
jgi:hypothetical protein